MVSLQCCADIEAEKSTRKRSMEKWFGRHGWKRTPRLDVPGSRFIAGPCPLCSALAGYDLVGEHFSCNCTAITSPWGLWRAIEEARGRQGLGDDFLLARIKTRLSGTVEFTDTAPEIVARAVNWYRARGERLSETGDWINGLCPLHRENRPSFGINSETGGWRCFGCHRSGNAVQFLRAVGLEVSHAR